MAEELKFAAEIWEYNGKGSWHFITLPKNLAEAVKESTTLKRGFGSVKVVARIGESKWLTSIFPDSQSGSYFLPIKKEVRVKNSLQDGDKTEVRLSIIDV